MRKINKPVTRHIHTGTVRQTEEEHVALLQIVTEVCMEVFSEWEYDFLRGGLGITCTPPSADRKKIMFFRLDRPGIVIAKVIVAFGSFGDGFGGETGYSYGVDISLKFYALESDSVEQICQQIKEKIN